MKLIIRSMILISIIFLLPKIYKSYELLSTGEEHVPFIKNIVGLYGTKSVIFLYAQAVKEMEMTTMVFKWTRAFSRDGFMTTNWYFSEMHESVYYIKRIVRPYYVAVISNYSAINEFSLATKTFDMSFGMWLVIFNYNGYGSDYCQTPPGNIFHLRYNSKMIVRCSTDNVLHEWYSIDNNRTEIIDIGKWNLTDGRIVDKISDSVYEEKKDNLHGLTIKATIVEDNKFVALNEHNQMVGIFGKIINELCRSLNFTFDLVTRVTDNGRWNPKTNTCSGAIEELCSKRVEVALSDFSMSSSRLNVVDFTIPLLVSKHCIYVKKPNRFVIKWSSYFLTFATTLWIAVFGIFIIASIALVFIKKRYQDDRCIVHLLSDNFLEILGIICQQGLSEFPDNSALRIAYISIFILSVVLSAAYSGALISFITAAVEIIPFHSLESFVDDGTYKFVVYRNSSDYDVFANSEDPIAKKLMNLMIDEKELPMTTEEAFKKICKNKKLVMYSSPSRKESVESEIPCNVIAIPTGRVESLAIVLSKHNQFTEIINYHLQKFINYGLMDRMKTTIFKKNEDLISYPKPVEMNSVLLLIFFILIGVILSTLILFLEKFIFACNSKKSLTNDRTNLSFVLPEIYAKQKNDIKNSRYYYPNRKFLRVRY